MKQYFKEKENRIIIEVFILTMLIACSPLITKYCINGHDIEYHLLRIESLREGILMGRPFLKVNMLFFGDAGYASSLFYPDFLLYFPALLRVCGVGINLSYHLFVAGCICLSYLSAYFCVKKMTESRYAGMLAAILLTLCPYHLDDIYVRSAVGEYTAFIFLPVIIYGIYNVLHEEMDKPWVLGIGYGGMLLCHTSTFVMCLLLGIAAFIVKYRSFVKKPKLTGKLLLTALLTAALTMPYWLPVMEQMQTTAFYVSKPWMNPKDQALTFAQIFYPTFPALGFGLVLFLFPRIFIKKEAENERLLNFADWLTAAGFLFAVFTTNLIPWDRIGSYLSFIQFPWRFFIMSSVLFAIAGAVILHCCIKGASIGAVSEKSVLLVVLLVMAAGAFMNLSENTEGYYDYSKDYYSYKPYTANVIAGEWLPQTVQDATKLVEQSEHLYTDSGEELIFERIKNSIAVNIDKEMAYVDVPFIYYKGYYAYLMKDGEKLKLTVTGEGENGLCRVYTDNQQGMLTVVYDGTFAQGFAIGVSIVAALVLLWLFFRRKKRSLILAGAALLGMGLCGCSQTVQTTVTEPEKIAAETTNDSQETVEVRTEKKNYHNIMINLSGYETTDQKIAVFRGTDLDETFDVVNADTNETVLFGYIVEAKENTKNGETNAKGDFSELTEPGSYYISTPSMGISDTFTVEKNHYQKLLDTRIEKLLENKQEQIADLTELNKSMMQTVDWMLTLDFFSADAKDSNISKLFSLTQEEMNLLKACQNKDGSITAGEEADAALTYRYAAVFAMFADLSQEQETASAKQYSEQATKAWSYAERALWKDAEAAKDERYWAAAQLYKLTGEADYCRIAQSYIRTNLPTGLSDEDTGYLGSLAYLKTTYKTELTLCNQIMQAVFDDAVRVINEAAQDGYLVQTESGYGEDAVLSAFSSARLLTIANVISKSVDYVDTVSNYLDYLYGRNPNNRNYAADESSPYYNEPETLILTGMLNSYIMK